MPWPHLQELIDSGGTLSVGAIESAPCAAIASDDSMLAALARRDGESLSDMLQRLDAAVAKAVEDEHFTDEINPP